MSDASKWVESPLLPDLAGVLAWSLLILVVLYAVVVGALFGVHGLWTYLWLVPVVLVIGGALGVVFVFLPMTARRVGVSPSGLSVVRIRAVEVYPWSGVKPGYRPPRTWPFIGHRYPISLSSSQPPTPQFVGLNRRQAELLASHLGGTVEQVWPRLPRGLRRH